MSIRMLIGLILSGLYALIGVVLIALAWHLEPDFNTNEMGDFMAGWFSPLAFTWFVFTAIMQGRELGLARETYNQQARELKRSADALEINLNHKQIDEICEAILEHGFANYLSDADLSNNFVSKVRELSTISHYCIHKFPDNIHDRIRNDNEEFLFILEDLLFEMQDEGRNWFKCKNNKDFDKQLVERKRLQRKISRQFTLVSNSLKREYQIELNLYEAALLLKADTNPRLAARLARQDWENLKLIYRTLRMLDTIKTELTN